MEHANVSAIIPTYNRAGFILDALDSIAAQSLPPSEIIVVDDGSTDNTRDLLAGRPGIRYFWREHRGVAHSRNFGLGMAGGEYVAWLDADDLWEPDFLRQALAAIGAGRDVDGVYTGIAHMDEAGRPLPQRGCRVVRPGDLYAALVEDSFIATPALVVRRRCYRAVGDFDTDLAVCEDYDMLLRLARAYTIVGVPAPLVRVRIHGGNTMANAEVFGRSRLAVTAKHFGPATGDVGDWSAEKRHAYAYALRSLALRGFEAGQFDKGWAYLGEAAALWPALLASIDTYYEIACAGQPRGSRGHPEGDLLGRNAAALLEGLAALFAGAPPEVQALRGKAFARGHLAIAMLHDQADDWTAARRSLWQAVGHDPALLASPGVARRLVKLSAGQTLVGLLRSAGRRRKST